MSSSHSTANGLLAWPPQTWCTFTAVESTPGSETFRVDYNKATVLCLQLCWPWCTTKYHSLLQRTGTCATALWQMTEQLKGSWKRAGKSRSAVPEECLRHCTEGLCKKSGGHCNLGGCRCGTNVFLAQLLASWLSY
jgi:hypothetical protein